MKIGTIIDLLIVTLLLISAYKTITFPVMVLFIFLAVKLLLLQESTMLAHETLIKLMRCLLGVANKKNDTNN
jgi:hypothetical protein